MRLFSEVQAAATAVSSPSHNATKGGKHHGRSAHRLVSVNHSHSAHSDHSSVGSNDTLSTKGGSRGHRNAVLGGVVGGGGGASNHSLLPERQNSASNSVASVGGKDRTNQLEPESIAAAKDISEQLADAYFRRAQAKLLLQQLQHSDLDLVNEALEDAGMVSHIWIYVSCWIYCVLCIISFVALCGWI